MGMSSMQTEGLASGVMLLHGQCDRVVKVMDSKSIGLCPQGLKSPRCREMFVLPEIWLCKDVLLPHCCCCCLVTAAAWLLAKIIFAGTDVVLFVF